MEERNDRGGPILRDRGGTSANPPKLNGRRGSGFAGAASSPSPPASWPAAAGAMGPVRSGERAASVVGYGSVLSPMNQVAVVPTLLPSLRFTTTLRKLVSPGLRTPPGIKHRNV